MHHPSSSLPRRLPGCSILAALSFRHLFSYRVFKALYTRHLCLDAPKILTTMSSTTDDLSQVTINFITPPVRCKVYQPMELRCNGVKVTPGTISAELQSFNPKTPKCTYRSLHGQFTCNLELLGHFTPQMKDQNATGGCIKQIPVELIPNLHHSFLL